MPDLEHWLRQVREVEGMWRRVRDLLPERFRGIGMAVFSGFGGASLDSPNATENHRNPLGSRNCLHRTQVAEHRPLTDAQRR